MKKTDVLCPKCKKPLTAHEAVTFLVTRKKSKFFGRNLTYYKCPRD